MDLNAIKSILQEDNDIKELITLKSNQLEMETNSSTYTTHSDLDQNWEKAETHVLKVFLNNFAKAESYVWETLKDKQPEFKDANTFICILGFILSNGDIPRLPSNSRSQNNYIIGLSYLSGVFCLGTQLIVGKTLKRDDVIKLFYQNDLVCKGLKHYVHNSPESPYFNYYKPFPDLDSKTNEEIIEILEKDQNLVSFLNYCAEEQERIFSQIEKILKL